MDSNQISELVYKLFVSMLFLAFIVLKLCQVINWSWWWVTSPVWINFLLIVLIEITVRLFKREEEQEDAIENNELEKDKYRLYIHTKNYKQIRKEIEKKNINP